MMRLLAAVVGVGLLAFPAGGCPKRVSDLERECLLGHVRSVRVDVAPLEFKRGTWVEGKSEPETVDRFDARGDRIESVRYSNREVVEYTSFRYKPDGSQEVESRLKSTGSIFALVSSEANAPSGAREWRTDRHVVRYNYDPWGTRVGAIEFDDVAGSLDAAGRVSFDYDEQGRIREERRFSVDDGSVVEIVEYVYASDGCLAKQIVRSGSGEVRRAVAFEAYRRDKAGNWTSRTESEWDAAGKLVEKCVRHRSIAYGERRAKPSAPGAVARKSSRPRTKDSAHGRDGDVAECPPTTESSTEEIEPEVDAVAATRSMITIVVPSVECDDATPLVESDIAIALPARADRPRRVFRVVEISAGQSFTLIDTVDDDDSLDVERGDGFEKAAKIDTSFKLTKDDRTDSDGEAAPADDPSK